MKNLILLLFILTNALVHANDLDSIRHEHNHPNHEIAIATGGAYFINENLFTFGLHGHYTYRFTHSIISVGIGYERLFDEHEHNALGVIFGIQPIGGLIVNISPGISFEKNEPFRFGSHLELSYEFELNNIHIGPVIETAFDTEDIHLSSGLHIGYAF